MAEPKLREYRRKRDPKKTPEPFSGKRKTKDPIFVIQRHDARRLHYDFRLERDGALASWAVPKGIPLEPGQRHLAVHVEDHPLDYATFEGEIPKGEYGAGTVEIWDRGTYELVEEKRDGGLTVRLHGERLDGLWTLVPAKLDGNPKNWLLLRKSEDGSGSARPQRRYTPMFATLADEKEMPRGEGWEFEIKWDGYRIVGYVAGGEAELRTRKDQDYTARFANVAKELAKAMKTPDCVVDGEVCALDEEGRPSFSAMQQAKAGTPIVYYLFDLLEVDGEPIVDLPLSERRARLEKLHRQAQPHRPVLGRLRRWPGADARGAGAAARGDHGQAARLEIPAREALSRLAQVQGALRAGARDRRLHPREGAPRMVVRLARPRGAG